MHSLPITTYFVSLIYNIMSVRSEIWIIYHDLEIVGFFLLQKMGLVLHLHDCPQTMLGTDTSIKRAGVIGLR